MPILITSISCMPETRTEDFAQALLFSTSHNCRVRQESFLWPCTSIEISQKHKWVPLMHACRLAIHTSSKRGVGQGDKMASGHEDDSGSGQEQTKKPSASTFHPTLWGDFFLSHEPPTSLQVYFCLRWAVVPALVNLLLWDRNGRLKGVGTDKIVYEKVTLIHIPKHLPSNCQNDTTQLVTCSS